MGRSLPSSAAGGVQGIQPEGAQQVQCSQKQADGFDLRRLQERSHSPHVPTLTKDRLQTWHARLSWLAFLAFSALSDEK